MDARQARRRLAGAPEAAGLLMSRAYALDDLTLGVLWAVANLDEALLDGDATLSHSRGQLHLYERLPGLRPDGRWRPTWLRCRECGWAGERMRALADYLDLDWAWLVRRCHELGEYGSAGIAQPRSRLLSTDGVDQACRFLAQAAYAAG
jgi:hypothetical protein